MGNFKKHETSISLRRNDDNHTSQFVTINQPTLIWNTDVYIDLSCVVATIDQSVQ